MAVYMLGFNTYSGFSNILADEDGEEAMLKRIYAYAKLLADK